MKKEKKQTKQRRIFNASAWLALLSVLALPGKRVSDGVQKSEYGFPFRFFTRYHEGGKSPWFIQELNINLLLFILNVVIYYVVIYGIAYLYQKNKSQRMAEEEKNS